MRRKTWALAAAAVLVAVTATGGVVVHVQRQASDPGRTGAAGEHREGGEGQALGHGLPGWDADLSGAIGRLAVLRDQPGPRDIHRAARERRQGRAAATCSIAWTTTPVVLLCGTVPAYRDLHMGDAGKDVRQLNRNLHSSATTPAPASYRSRRQHFHLETERALKVLQHDKGSHGDRSACPRRCGLPARVGADRQGDRRARRIRPAGCTGPERHIRHAARCRWTSMRRSRVRSRRATVRRSRCPATRR